MSAGGNGRLTIFQAAAVDDQRLGNAAFRVLAALGSYADADGFCYPSQGTIADRLKVSRQAVAKCIAQLVALGYVTVTHQFLPNGAKRNSLYRLNFAIIAPMQPDIASPMQPEVTETQPDVATMQPQKLHPMQPDIASHATSEVAYNVPSERSQENDPKKVTREQRPRPIRVTIDTYEPDDDFLEGMAAERPDLRLPLVVSNWRDYHREKGDTVKDFEASLRRWIRNEKVAVRAAHTNGAFSTGDDYLARNRAYIDRKSREANR